MSVKSLQEYTRYAKYARYIPALKRRETWDEQIDRVFSMHETKLANVMGAIDDDLDFAKNLVRKKRVLGSQRALQFGGPAILDKESRMYNCTVSYIDRPRFFQECLYLLLCGCGAGFSAQKHHVAKLPKVGKRTKVEKTFVVPDTIEGWSDALGILLASYWQTEHTEFSKEYRGHSIKFDFSQIRKEGSPLSWGGKAPGPNGLEKSLILIQEVVERQLDNSPNLSFQLRPIDAYDIAMHSSDAVLSGGIRRSATICLFSYDDDEMINAKTGNWFLTDPQRGRSNNSAVLIRGEITKDDFNKLMKSVQEFGEPGFVWAEDVEALYNPCVEIGMWAYWEDDGSDKWKAESKNAYSVSEIDGKKCLSGWQFCVSGDTKLITKNGIEDISNCVGKKIEIWNGNRWSEVEPFHTGSNRELYRVELSDGSFLDCTDNHRWKVKDRFMKEYSVVETKNLMSFSKYPIHAPSANIKFSQGTSEPDAYEYGYVLGDGCAKRTDTKKGTRLAFAHIFDGDSNLDMQCREVGLGVNENGSPYQTVVFDQLDRDFTHSLKYSAGLPKEIFSWDRESVRNFFAGWIDADGSKQGRGFRIYGSKDKLQDAQLLMTKMGIYSSVNLMSEAGTETNLGIRKNDVWYIQVSDVKDLFSKRLNIEQVDRKRNGKGTHQNIVSVTKIDGLHETFCLTEKENHLCVFNNVLTHQCNLCEINMRKCKTKEDFLESCKAAAILGTVQASYDNFEYLGTPSHEIVSREALLGCSMTGMMDSPEVAFDTEIQKEGARLILKTNKEMAKKIGINPCARATCVKPAGTTSCILGSASGVHPHHAKRYIRRVQANKMEFPAQYFGAWNPLAVEDSVWSAHGTDVVLSFCCEVPDGAKTKNQVNAISLLEHVKLTQQNWVKAGTRTDISTKKWLRHNVSNTITVKPDEWEAVGDFIFKNQRWFAGISLLPFSGDLDYPQAPFVAIFTPLEIVREYGEGSLMASGLIVDGLRSFDNNLWAACDSVIGIGENLDLTDDERKLQNGKLKSVLESKMEKSNWVRRVGQFSERYCSLLDEDVVFVPSTDNLTENEKQKEFQQAKKRQQIKRATHLMKKVHCWKLWCDLNREYKDIDWSLVVEDDYEIDMENMSAGAACSGGECDLMGMVSPTDMDREKKLSKIA